MNIVVFSGEKLKKLEVEQLSEIEELLKTKSEKIDKYIENLPNFDMPGLFISRFDPNADFNHEIPKFEEKDIPDTDVDLVISQTECTEEMAKTMLVKNRGDIVNAIMEIQFSF